MALPNKEKIRQPVEYEDERQWSLFISFLVFLSPSFTVGFTGACIGVLLNFLLFFWSMATMVGPESKYKELAETLMVGCFFAIPITIGSLFSGIPLGLLILMDAFKLVRGWI